MTEVDMKFNKAIRIETVFIPYNKMFEVLLKQISAEINSSKQILIIFHTTSCFSVWKSKCHENYCYYYES